MIRARVAGDRTRLVWWALLLSSGLVVGVGVVGRTWPLIVDTTVGSRAESSAPPAQVGLPGRPVPILDSPHIPVGKAGGVRYNSVPPTSGPHFAVPPAPGIYATPLADGLQIHALEHGHVGIQYAPDTTPEVVQRLRRLGARYPRDVFVAPYPGLMRGIALTAWGRIDDLNELDESRINRFVLAMRGRYDHGWRGSQGSDR
jgi:Protein of unknown function (DUF3105)